MSNLATWSPDAGILAHLTNGVLPDTSFWDELQQNECRSVDEFYTKARKYLKLEDSKEALCKTEGTTTGKKNNPRAGVDGQKGQDKRRGKDKRAKSLKKIEKWAIGEQRSTPKVYQLPFPHGPAGPRLCCNGQKSL